MDDVDENRFKSLCRFFLERGADEGGLRLFHSAIVNERETKSAKARAHSPQTKIQQRAAAIVEETAQVAITGNVLPGYHDAVSGKYKPVPQISIPGPSEEYAWTTRDLLGFEAARDSAVNAVQRLWATTHAAQAGYNSKTPRLDVFLLLIRAGRIKNGDPVIQDAINFADKNGFSGNIRERIAEEFHNAEKRVVKDYCGVEIGNSLFYDLNWFRITLAVLWVGALFWLMPDWLIADFLRKKKWLPPRIKCNRQTISEAVKQMGLVKHDPPIVKSIGDDFKLSFVEGYLPTS